jgi:hypothetical protein
METMFREYKGEVLYNQEVDKHFAHLTVGQTLEFAATARTPEHRLQGVGRQEFAKYVTKVAMSIFGLSHTYNTKGMLSIRARYYLDDSDGCKLAMIISEVFRVVRENELGLCSSRL